MLYAYFSLSFPPSSLSLSLSVCLSLSLSVSLCLSHSLTLSFSLSLSVALSVFHFFSLYNRWNSSAMRRWLKENNLVAGSGAPLHNIAAIEDLQRALASFSGILQYSVLRSKEEKSGREEKKRRVEEKR